MLTPEQAAQKACVSVSLVYAWCGSGRLVHYRMGKAGKRGVIRIEETDFEGFLQTLKVSETIQDDGELKFLK